MHRNATLLVLISLLDGFGSTAMALSAGLWLLDLTHSVSLAALVAICTYAPTFLGPWIGAMVDRLPRRPLMIAAELATALLLLTLLRARAAWLIFAVLLLRGILSALVDAGETAILPSALPPAALGTVNGWRSSALEGTKLLAPLAGAGLYAWRGPTPVTLLCAALPLTTAFLYALLKLPPATPAPSASGGAWAGVPLLFRLPAVRTPVLIAAVAIALSGLTNAAVLAHLVDDLHLPSTRLGLITSAQGAGSILSGLLAGRLLARLDQPRLRPTRLSALGAALVGPSRKSRTRLNTTRRSPTRPSPTRLDPTRLSPTRLGSTRLGPTRLGPTRLAVLGVILFGLGRLAWALPWFPPAVAGSLIIGIGLPWTLIAGITAIQTETPAHLLGRAGASANTAMFGPIAATIPLGSAVVHFGTLAPTLLASTLAFAAAVYGTKVYGPKAYGTATPQPVDADG